MAGKLILFIVAVALYSIGIVVIEAETTSQLQEYLYDVGGVLIILLGGFVQTRTEVL